MTKTMRQAMTVSSINPHKKTNKIRKRPDTEQPTDPQTDKPRPFALFMRERNGNTLSQFSNNGNAHHFFPGRYNSYKPYISR